jgi:murein L,D-transpeptidase YafK
MRWLVVVMLSAATAHADPCPSDTAIVISTAAHRMTLCEGGHAIHEYRVAIGGGGIGKQREGDRKTPLGSYSLATPRESVNFHQFIEIGYPTAEQRDRGFTGSAVGIHGPSRKHAWLGRLRNYVDWTDGCVAVSSDDAIDEVAAWAARAKPARVIIE